MIAERGSVAAKTVARAATVGRTRCYCVPTELRARGLIHDKGSGYELVAADVWAGVNDVTDGCPRTG